MRTLWDFKRGNDIGEKARLVLLGHQKSGTTVVASLLSKISGLNMSNDPLYQIDKGKARAVEGLIKNPKLLNKLCNKHSDLFNKEIIKDPDLVFIYQAVKECFTNACFLFVVRDPRDTIRSICNRLNLSGTDINSHPKSAEMKGGNHHWELILSGQLPWITDINGRNLCFVEHLAYRWRLAADIYLNNSNDMILVKYEDFRQEKEKIIFNLAGELKLPVNNSITKYADVQYQPRGNSNISWVDFFGEKNLHKIENISRKHLNYFGYMC